MPIKSTEVTGAQGGGHKKAQGLEVTGVLHAHGPALGSFQTDVTYLALYSRQKGVSKD
jgi:hypothetical protein